MAYDHNSRHILIINGPNLNLLGRREPEIYGTDTLDEIIAATVAACSEAKIEHFQSSHEGAIIDRLHQAMLSPDGYRGVVLNAGAYSHTSLAIADAVAAIDVPVIEVHLSNIYAREEIRHTSLIAPVAKGQISGLGKMVYQLAVKALLD